MRYRRLDLNLLIALDVLLTERSVTRAAEKLHMTQPAMSGALARLRENFEDPLLVPVGRQLQLTPRAESLLEPLNDIIRRIDSALDIEPEFEPNKNTRHFVIVASDYVIAFFLNNILKKIHIEAPGISFEFRQPSNNSQMELDSGDVDFVIVPQIDILAEHPHAKLFEDSYTTIAWDKNTVIDNEISLDQYTMLGHASFCSKDKGIPWFDRWFIQEFGDLRRIALSISSFTLLPQLIVGTDYIATLQRPLAEEYAKTLPLKLLPLPFEPPVLIEYLQWNKYREEDNANQWLREKLITEAKSFSNQ